ncbi:SKI family transcriptional corepressor 1 homolog-B-like isoform X2 [Physella acuta]|uniref:SKI family transcriptional corepressor 1 homolog-B-like isoform X2 n=1 Tax=Physella acuta TaxID=109671 RepID=UPI0027DE6050|nr:SKI family transcriptional corepressor 1 homolog-B-like isoform X2 [Physella acuta]
MDTPAIDSCLAGGMGVACRSPIGQWPSPPAAHTHNSILNSSSLLGNPTGYMGFSTTASDNENSNSAMSDCSPRGGGAMTPNSTNTTNASSSSSGSKSNSSGRQNQVGTIMLHGVAIVSLVIDNKERLCLAQISNTLLKDYSYNEIHNRRVALGITCVQCTPVQLEILRRAGAMPVSSRRCGMITKREAERLVKSFLEENTPPKLPEDFAFDVHHECGWGCRGFFEPSRYNSSRAKCIKCTYCNMYFSPNKFIFHFHRTPESKYNHPDAANFNSWRRHLKLYTGHDNEEIAYKWEDVKAMFNGGTRKRVFTHSSASSSSPSTLPSSSVSSSNHTTITYSGRSHSRESDGGSAAKKTKMVPTIETNPYLPKPPPFPNPFNPYNWIAASAPGKPPYPFMAMNTSQSMCFGFPQQPPPNKDLMADRLKSTPMAPNTWVGRSNPHFPLSSMDLFWDKAFGFPPNALGFRNGGYHAPNLAGTAAAHTSVAPTLMESSEHLSPHGEHNPCATSPHGLPQNLIKQNYERREKMRDRMSAFKRVVPTSSSPSSSSLSPHLSPNIENDGHAQNDFHRDNSDDEDNSLCAQDLTTHKDIEDSEEIDVEEDADERKRKTADDPEDDNIKSHYEGKKEQDNDFDSSRHSHSSERASSMENCDEGDKKGPRVKCVSPSRPGSASSDDECQKRGTSETTELPGQDSGLSDESETETENPKHVGDTSKENFRDDVNREKAFREHMAQQLEMLRETLTTELEQERKIRFSLQQKLKEAHDALQNFSCGLLTGRRDVFSLKETAISPR